MTIVKICSKHGDLTEDDLKKGIYKGKRYRKCKHCELERSRAYHEQKYNDPEWVAEKHARDKKRWEEKKDEITKQRQSPEKMEMRRETYRRLAPRYRERCNAKQQEYRDTLHDHYIKKCIQNGDKSLRMNDIPKGMVELKRSIMILKKGIRKQQTDEVEMRLDEIKKHRTSKKSHSGVTGRPPKKQD